MAQERRKGGRRRGDRRAARDNRVTLSNDESTGGVQHDERGQARWTWASEQFAHEAADRTFDQLKALDNDSLSLLEAPGPGKAKPAPGGGYNPYNTDAPVAKKPPAKPRR